MKTAYSYIRFSTVGQAKGDSKRRQMAAGQKWCLANGYTLSDNVFFDKGKSAFKGTHLEEDGELKRFLDLIENGTIKKESVLLVENFDRLSRLPPIRSISLFLDLIRSGIGLVFTLSYDNRIINEDLVNKEGNILQMIIGECIRAHTESQRKSETIKQTKQAKLSRMRKGEKLPHNNVPKYFSWNREKRDYDHNHNTPAVKRLVKEYLAGQSLYGVAKLYNKEKIKTFRRGFEWSACSVRAILRNPCLIGQYLGNKDFLPAIISSEDFDRVQILLSRNHNNRGKKADLTNIFRGLAFCSFCGSAMNVLNQSLDYRTKKRRKRAYRYLRCAMRASGKSCQANRMLGLDNVEVELFSMCLLQNPKQIISGDDNQDLEALNSAISLSQGIINQVTEQIKKLAAVNAEIPEPELKEEMIKLGNKRRSERELLDNLNIQRAQMAGKSQQYDDFKVLFDNCDGNDMSEYEAALSRLEESLANDEIRKQIRVMLPSLIGKIVVNTERGMFEVFNHSGKSIYVSSDPNQLYERVPGAEEEYQREQQGREAMSQEKGG